MKNRHRQRLAATAALLAVLALGACSDDDGDGGDAGTTPSTVANGSAAEGGNAVDIADFAFQPAELTVEAGTTVTFTNKDDFAHTATAKDKSFDTGNLDKDGSFEHTFDEPGTYAYLCAIHNSMTGTITVS